MERTLPNLKNAERRLVTINAIGEGSTIVDGTVDVGDNNFDTASLNFQDATEAGDIIGGLTVISSEIVTSSSGSDDDEIEVLAIVLPIGIVLLLLLIGIVLYLALRKRDDESEEVRTDTEQKIAKI